MLQDSLLDACLSGGGIVAVVHTEAVKMQMQETSGRRMVARLTVQDVLFGSCPRTMTAWKWIPKSGTAQSLEPDTLYIVTLDETPLGRQITSSLQVTGLSDERVEECRARIRARQGSEDS